jgi:translocation and assembly module TamB
MRRPARLAIAGVAALLASAATLIVAVWIFGNTDGGRTWIERLTYRLTSGHVKLTGLGGSFPARLELAQLELSDARGVWLTAERLKGDWAPLELLWGEIRVGTLQAAKVHMERLPVSTTPASTNKVSIPHIDVAALSVAVVELGPELAGAPASLTLDGDVRLRSLDEMAGYLTARRIGGDGEYALRAGFDLQRMDADLKLHEPAGGPLEHLLGLPGLGALSATVSLHGLRKAEHLELVLDAGEAHARARGDVNLGAYSADLDYSLEAPAMAPRPDLSWQRIGLHGRWHGSLITPAADGQLAMEQLRLPGGTAVATLNAALTASGGSLGVRADVGGLQIAGPQPRLFADAPLTIDATMKMNDARRTVVLLASHRLFRLRAEAVTAGVPSVSVQVNLTDVAPFAALAGADAQGTATLDARLSQDGAITQIGLDATAALADGRSRLSVIAGNRVTLALSAALGPQRLEVERLQLSADAGALELSGSASRPVPGSRANAAPGAARSISDFVSDLRARWEVKMSNLGVLSTGLAGTLTASGDLRGAPLDLGLTAQVAATVSVHGSPPGAIDAKVQARGLPTLGATATPAVSSMPSFARPTGRACMRAGICWCSRSSRRVTGRFAFRSGSSAI